MSLLANIFDDSDELEAAKALGLTLDDLKMFFNEFDVDGSGSIDEGEFGTLLASVGKMPPPDVLRKMVASIDKDEDGKIDFKEFCSWWVSDGISFDSDCPVLDYECYEYDYDLTEEENDAAQIAFDESMWEKREQAQEERWQREAEMESSQEAVAMLKAKMMAPLYFKSLSRKIKGLTDSPCDQCTNSLTVQVGQPEDRGSVRVFTDTVSEFAELDPPKHTAMALVVEFSLQDDYCQETLKTIQDTADRLFKQFVEPMLGEVNKVPRELRKSGLVSGKPFDSYRFDVTEGDGGKVLRLCVFSGVDVLAAFSKETGAEMAKLCPTMSAKFTTGFSLDDILNGSDAKLKDMLQWKFEAGFNWCKNYILLCLEFSEMFLKLNGQLADDYDRRDFSKRRMATTAFTKAFCAQRSLFYFQFNSILDWAREMVHEVGLPMLLEQIEAAEAPFFKGPPTREQIDAVIDAIGNISGKTLGAARAHLLADLKLRKYTDDGSRFGSILWVFQLESRIKEALEEAAKEDGDETAKLIAELWGLFAGAHKVFKGLNSVKIEDRVATSGAEFKGFDFMQFVPTPEQILEAEGTESRATWVEQWARNFQGDDSKGVPDEAFMAKLGEEASELAEVVKAAWCFRECFDMDWLNEQSGGMATKAEDEAKKFFNIV